MGLEIICIMEIICIIFGSDIFMTNRLGLEIICIIFGSGIFMTNRLGLAIICVIFGLDVLFYLSLVYMYDSY